MDAGGRRSTDGGRPSPEGRDPWPRLPGAFGSGLPYVPRRLPPPQMEEGQEYLHATTGQCLLVQRVGRIQLTIAASKKAVKHNNLEA